MKCERIQDLTSEALDGQLKAAEAEAFHSHLADCRACQVYFAELRESLALLNDLPTIEVDESFDRAVMRRLRDEAPRVHPVGQRRAALREFLDRLAGGAPIWRWGPVGVGVAAGLLILLAAGRGPVPGTEDRMTAQVVSGVTPAAQSERAPTNGETVVAAVDGSIPEAIERYLSRHPARELRLDGRDSDDYLRANYSYPLRRIPDSAPRDLYGGGIEGPVPVSGTMTRQPAIGPLPDPRYRLRMLKSRTPEVLAF